METYRYPVEHPYDLDAGLDFVRPITGVAHYPYPQTIGHIEGLSPLYDKIGRYLSSVQINAQVLNILNNQNLQSVFPDIQGGLRKVLG